jgi:hypothetical protein
MTRVSFTPAPSLVGMPRTVRVMLRDSALDAAEGEVRLVDGTIG